MDSNIELHDPPDPPAVTQYVVDRTPLKGSPRSDWHVAGAEPPSTALERPDFVNAMRDFFGRMDAEIDRYKDDPIATTNALARVEALLGDVRYVRDRLAAVTADSMNTQKIRRLSIEHVATVEASATIKRSDWDHPHLLGRVLATRGVRGITDDGEIVKGMDLAALLLEYFTPDWRLTPLRDLAIDPHDYCTVATDDETGKVIKTPTVKIVTNAVKGRR